MILGLLLLVCPTAAWRSPAKGVTFNEVSRRGVFGAGAAACLAAVSPSKAVLALEPKRLNLKNDELAKIVTADLVDRQFLATADFTRAVYDESATFTDEIDSYTLDKFIKGTSKLFVADRSHVELTSPVIVTSEKAEFTFSENLCFNIPFKPVVYVSGKVVLTRDPTSGLFTAYREYWDQKPGDVVRAAKF